MAYEQPNIEIYQEFVPTPVSAAQVQYVGVVASQYGVHEDTALGEYAQLTGIPAMDYPERQEDASVIDTVGITVTMKNGVLSYLKDTGATVTVTGGNKITLTKVIAGEDLDPAFGERPVQIGDYVRFITPGEESNSTDQYTEAKVVGIERVAGSSTIGPVSPVNIGDESNSNIGTPTATGTYKGTVDDTYIIKITSGGELTASAGTVVVAVTTQNGSAGFPSLVFDGASENDLGATGIQLGLPAGEYVTGDVYKFDVTASGTGAYKVIKIDTLINATAGDTLEGFELGAFLDFTVNPDSVIKTDKKVSIVPWLVENVALLTSTADDYEVIKGSAQISYRERLLKNTKAVQVATVEDFATVAGSVSVKNPLGAMVSAAIATGGENVYFVALTEDTVDGYIKAFEILAGVPDVYSVVLQSMDQEVVTSAMAFVNAQSSERVANYRILWYGLNDSVDVAKYTKTTQGLNILITADGSTVTGGANVNFASADVEVGDILRTNYSKDADGNETFSEYPILSVNGNTLVVDGTPDITVAVKAEVWKRLTDNDELIQHMVSEVSTSSRRAYAVYGDGITVGGIANAPTYVQAAAAAGMRAGNYPQAPLTNRTYDASANPVHDFTVAQLNKLAERGVWIIASDNNGVVFNRHQLSTDMSDLKYREQSYTTALDQISKGAKAIFSVYHGISNISDDLIKQLSADTTTYLSQQVAIVPNVTVGSLLKSYSNLVIYQDEVNKDHLYMTVDYELQAPFNFGTITQRVL